MTLTQWWDKLQTGQKIKVVVLENDQIKRDELRQVTIKQTNAFASTTRFNEFDLKDFGRGELSKLSIWFTKPKANECKIEGDTLTHVTTWGKGDVTTIHYTLIPQVL